ncbi:MAG: aldehyde ferredoxin oxidoreductase family protein [Thermodesulfobacteriota bacterium]
MSTLSGRLLRIDLGRRTSAAEDVPRGRYASFLSARGLGVKYLYDELAPGTDPLGPDNKLILLMGALGATGLQGFSKWAAVSRSPLTGTIFRSVAGGNFGAWMKFAGYDLVIVEGRAERPLYVHVDGAGVRFLEARELWGLDPRRTQARLKEIHGPRTEAACIGLAGENQVRYAAIAAGERTAARGGLGAVMGAKNLKAVSFNVPAVRPAPHDPERFAALVKKQAALLKDHPRRINMSTYGTPYITTVVDRLGVLPVRNFRAGRLPGVESIDGEEFRRLKKARAGCFQCLTRCGGWRAVGRGPYAGTDLDGPEYETIYAFGPLLGLADPAFIIDANALCDYYGLDTISTGVCAALVLELREKGLLSDADAGGLSLEWGDGAAVFRLIEMIARREGLGGVLAEGVRRAAASIGGGAEALAMHVKGLEMPGYDPRGVKGYALSYAVSNIGGSHMYGRPRDELSGRMDPYTETGKGEIIARVQMEQAIEDSLVACTFSNTGLDLNFYAQALAAATGLPELGSAEALRQTGERIMCLERCFNVREGLDRRDDALPARLVQEPLPDAGPATGRRVEHLDGLLDEYYQALGYDQNGVPFPDKMKELGLAGQ